MSQTVFYSVKLPACRCGRPASHEIQASGNVRYDRVCPKCRVKRLRELVAAHKAEAPELEDAS